MKFVGPCNETECEFGLDSGHELLNMNEREKRYGKTKDEDVKKWNFKTISAWNRWYSKLSIKKKKKNSWFCPLFVSFESFSCCIWQKTKTKKNEKQNKVVVLKWNRKKISEIEFGQRKLRMISERWLIVRTVCIGKMRWKHQVVMWKSARDCVDAESRERSLRWDFLRFNKLPVSKGISSFARPDRVSVLYICSSPFGLLCSWSSFECGPFSLYPIEATKSCDDRKRTNVYFSFASNWFEQRTFFSKNNCFVCPNGVIWCLVSKESSRRKAKAQ